MPVFDEVIKTDALLIDAIGAQNGISWDIIDSVDA
jgi:hypothetical protein